MSSPISIPRVIDQLSSSTLSTLKQLSTQEPPQADKPGTEKAGGGRLVWCDGHTFSVVDPKACGMTEKKIVSGSFDAGRMFRDEISRLFCGDVPKSVERTLGRIKPRTKPPLEVRRLTAVLTVADMNLEFQSGLSVLRAPMEKGDRAEYLAGLEKVLDSRLQGLDKPLPPDATMLKAYAETIRQSICGTPEELMNLRSILAAADKTLTWEEAQGKGTLGLTLKALCSGTLAMIDAHADEWMGVSAKAGEAPREAGGKMAEFEDSLNELADAVARFDGPAAKRILLRQQELLAAGKNDPVVGLYGELAKQIAGGDGTGGIFGGDRKYLEDTRAILENLHELAVRKDDSLAPELRVARRQTAHVCETLLRELVSFDAIRVRHVAAAKAEMVEGEDAQDVRSIMTVVSERPQELVDKAVEFGSPSERRRINRFSPVGELVNPRNVRALLGRVREALPKDARKGRALVIARSFMQLFAEIRFRQLAKGGKVSSFDELMEKFAQQKMIGSCDFTLDEQQLERLKGPLHDRFVNLLAEPVMGKGYRFSPETGVLSITQRELRTGQIRINGQSAQPVVGEVKDGEKVVSEEVLRNDKQGAAGTATSEGLAYHALMIRSFPGNSHLRSVVSSLTSMSLDVLSGVHGLFTAIEPDLAAATKIRSGEPSCFSALSECFDDAKELSCLSLDRNPIDKGMYDIRTDSEGRVRIEAYRGVGVSLIGKFIDDLAFAKEDMKKGIVCSAQTYRAVMTIDPKKMIEGNDICKDYPDVTIESLEALDTPESWPDVQALKARFPD